ncbi:MAG: hypothetical protein KF746_00040 [Chitinophagaceae bacterium]|nr:hypothetical protein [Chitinophagaceae bacterium]
MKKNICYLLFTILIAGIIPGCSKNNDAAPVPIAPILKEIVFPNENDVIPGKEATILGKGFSKEDKIFIEADNGMLEVEVTGATNDYIRFIVPAESGGLYTVTVERAGKQTTLDGELSVPFIVVLENVVMPASGVQQGATVKIEGEGFQDGDILQLTAAFYPEGKTYNIPVTITAKGISFLLPTGAYGANNAIITRGEKKTNLGTIGIEVNAGDELGGGIVYYTESNKVHGFIVSKTNTGTPEEQFGPAVALSGAAGTGKSLGSGKVNTAKLIDKMNAFRQNNSSWNTKKSAAEMCNELSITAGDDTYTDWFLPSQEELIEIFKVKNMLWDKGAGMPANNYWSSSEGDGDAAGWSAFYVNFYEPENIVSGNSDKEGWKIGIRAIRSF